ncbi:MAG: hypothetical protein HQL67_08080 [Magnetococcales bacterium]|nr:hypothetical protein [Magnetococcales bacterium]
MTQIISSEQSGNESTDKNSADDVGQSASKTRKNSPIPLKGIEAFKEVAVSLANAQKVSAERQEGADEASGEESKIDSLPVPEVFELEEGQHSDAEEVLLAPPAAGTPLVQRSSPVAVVDPWNDHSEAEKPLVEDGTSKSDTDDSPLAHFIRGKVATGAVTTGKIIRASGRNEALTASPFQISTSVGAAVQANALPSLAVLEPAYSRAASDGSTAVATVRTSRKSRSSLPAKVPFQVFEESAGTVKHLSVVPALKESVKKGGKSPVSVAKSKTANPLSNNPFVKRAEVGEGLKPLPWNKISLSVVSSQADGSGSSNPDQSPLTSKPKGGSAKKFRAAAEKPLAPEPTRGTRSKKQGIDQFLNASFSKGGQNDFSKPYEIAAKRSVKGGVERWEVPVEGLGDGIVNTLGDAVGGIVNLGRKIFRFGKKTKKTGAVQGRIRPIQPTADTRIQKVNQGHAIKVYMIGQTVSGVYNIVTGIGQVVKGGVQILVGLVGYVGGVLVFLSLSIFEGLGIQNKLNVSYPLMIQEKTKQLGRYSNSK